MFRCIPSDSRFQNFSSPFPRSAVKVRSHVMYTDTSHNSLSTVYINIYRSMLVVALKFQAYVQEWGTDPRRKTGFLYSALSSFAVCSKALTRFGRRRDHPAGCQLSVG